MTPKSSANGPTDPEIRTLERNRVNWTTSCSFEILQHVRRPSSRVVIGHGTDVLYSLPYRWSIVTMRLSCTEISWSKDLGMSTLTFGGHVTSSPT